MSVVSTAVCEQVPSRGQPLFFLVAKPFLLFFFPVFQSFLAKSSGCHISSTSHVPTHSHHITIFVIQPLCCNPTNVSNPRILSGHTRSTLFTFGYIYFVWFRKWRATLGFLGQSCVTLHSTPTAAPCALLLQEILVNLSLMSKCLNGALGNVK